MELATFVKKIFSCEIQIFNAESSVLDCESLKVVGFELQI